MSHPSRAILVVQFLTQFEDVTGGYNGKAPWKLWAEIERKVLFEVLRDERPDQRWVQAAALTVKAPPPEVIALLLGDEDAFFLPEEAILERFPPTLLDACLSMHTGHPQPLWWIGIHHRTDEPWNSLLLRIAHDPRHFLFDLAVRELLLLYSEYDRTPEYLEIWKELTEKSTSDTCRRLFEHLLRWTARITGAPFQAHWEALFRSPRAEQLLPSWYDRIIEALRDIERSDNLRIFLKFPPFLDVLLDRFPQDLAVLRLLSQPVTNAIKERIGEQYETDPPKLLRVHNKVLDVLEGRRDSPDPLIQKVFQVRKEWFDQEDRENDPWNDHYELMDWVRA